MSYRTKVKSDSNGTLVDLPLDAETVKGVDVVNTKQDTLVSGTNIKTINNESILGSGNITISGGTTYTAGTGISISSNTISNTGVSYTTTAPSSANTSGDLKFVVLSSEPATKYSGYIYLVLDNS